jgi:ribosomal protein S18 acetylase RimI-like enzyme
MMTITPSIAPKNHNPPISVRPITADDLPFLLQLYASTRMEELAVTDWSADQQQAFLTAQFQAQHAHYQQHYPHATFDLILLDGLPIGRIYLAHGAEELRVVDIALLPEYRRRGIGSAFLQAICDQGAQSGLTVRLYVEQFNPALELYARLGFQPIATHGVYYLMERRTEVLHA